MMGNTHILEIIDYSGGYGESDTLNQLNLEIPEGGVVVVIGPNGAGKSTAIKAIFGLLQRRQGEILYKGAAISDLAPQAIVQLGIGYVPQVANVFPSLTVQENLEMGGYLLRGSLSTRLNAIYELFPALRGKRKAVAGTLSGGQRQMLAIGKVLMLQPELLLLDEPTAGLSPRIRQEIFELVVDLNQQGLSILMVEQNAKQALKIADTAYLLVDGKNQLQGSGRSLLENQEVATMFLGGVPNV